MNAEIRERSYAHYLVYLPNGRVIYSRTRIATGQWAVARIHRRCEEWEVVGIYNSVHAPAARRGGTFVATAERISEADAERFLRKT